MSASVWLAVLCYPAGPAGRRVAPRLCRWIWTVGGAAWLVHLLGAFHVHYAWSHAVAVRETARQSAELTGVAFGAGLWLNYLFVGLWWLDAAWWWRDPEGHRSRGRRIDVGLHAFLLFILFNGTVVFATGAARWLGAAVSAVGGGLLIAAHFGRSGRR